MAQDLPTPLKLLITTMHQKWGAGELDEAVALAKAVAPYLHPKAAAGQASESLAAMKDDTLDELCGPGKDGTGAEEVDQE